MGSFLDKAGRLVKVGDLIVYPCQVGCVTFLRFGKVRSIKLDPKEGWAIGVRGVDDFYGAPRALGPGTLRYPDRTVRVDSVPDTIRSLLE